MSLTFNVIETLLISHEGCDLKEYMIYQVWSPFNKNPTQSDLSKKENVLTHKTQKSRHGHI